MAATSRIVFVRKPLVLWQHRNSDKSLGPTVIYGNCVLLMCCRPEICQFLTRHLSSTYNRCHHIDFFLSRKSPTWSLHRVLWFLSAFRCLVLYSDQKLLTNKKCCQLSSLFHFHLLDFKISVAARFWTVLSLCMIVLYFLSAHICAYVIFFPSAANKMGTWCEKYYWDC